MTDPHRWAYVALIYAAGAAGFGLIQALHNRRYGMADQHSASWWFVAALWYPLLIWVLIVSAREALRRKANP